MNPGGLVILVAGVWLGCQVFGGNMLERLGILTAATASPGTGPAVYTPPAPSNDVHTA